MVHMNSKAGGGRACYGGIIVMLVVFISLTEGGTLVLAADRNRQDTSCLNQLAPCLNYLNGTRSPPDVCCDPLKEVIKSKPECLCSMISNRGTDEAEQAGINVNEAQQLPARCGQRVNPLSCLSSNSPNTSKNSVPNSGSSSLLFGGSMPATTAFFLSVQIILVGIKYNFYF